MPVVSALGRLRQMSHEFRSSLGHTVIKASLNYISISERQRRGERGKGRNGSRIISS